MTVDTPPTQAVEPRAAKSVRTDREFPEDGAKLMDRANRMGGQLGNWVMAGNAGGIAFILTTKRELETTTSFSLAPAYTGFLWGVVLAFVGHVLIILSSSAAAWAMAKLSAAEERIERRTKLTAALAKQGTPRPPEFDTMDAEDTAVLSGELVTSASVPLAVFGLLAYTVAAALAVWGLASPIFLGML